MGTGDAGVARAVVAGLAVLAFAPFLVVPATAVVTAHESGVPLVAAGPAEPRVSEPAGVAGRRRAARSLTGPARSAPASLPESASRRAPSEAVLSREVPGGSRQVQLREGPRRPRGLLLGMVITAFCGALLLVYLLASALVVAVYRVFGSRRPSQSSISFPAARSADPALDAHPDRADWPAAGGRIG